MTTDKDCDGYISKIAIGGKVYKLRCEVVEVHPITCKNCGASFELHYGEGICEHCGTHYSTRYFIEEN